MDHSCVGVSGKPYLEGIYNHRGLLQLPLVEDDHGMPTGHLQLLASSSIEPSLWLTVVNYPQPPCGDFPGHPEERNLGLHLRAWQARRIAAQLLHMADHVDPGGTDEPDTDAVPGGA